MVYFISSTCARLFLSVFSRVEVKGRESIPKNSSFILASNHISNLDPVVLSAFCPRRVHFLAKQELFKNKLFSFYLKQAGVIPLNREKGSISAIKAALKLLKDNKALLIFPQGTRSAELDRTLPGIGYLFSKTKAPIIIAKIWGTDKVLPRGKKVLVPHKIKVAFEKVEVLDDSKDYSSIAYKVLESIKNIEF